MKKAFISVGEVSGDMYAAKLIENLPDFQWSGIVGPRLNKKNVKSVANISDISVVGLTEALPKYRKIKQVFNQSLQEIKNTDLVIAIDFPGFNLKLLREAKKLGKKTVYFIPPQVWAWGKSRIKKIVEYSDLIIIIFPFEKELYKSYEKHKGQVQYAGHPLLDIIEVSYSEEQLKEILDIPKNKKILGLFPGSRESEVKTLLPILLKTAELVKRVYPQLETVIPVTENVKNIALEIANKSFVPVRIVSQQDIPNISHEVMDKAFFSLIASGTATLEAAIIGNPFALVYKVSPLTFFIGKRLVSIDFLGLPNIIAGREVIKEFLQEDCNPVSLANYTIDVLDSHKKYHQIKEDLKIIKGQLGERGAIKRAAKLIEDLMLK